MDAVHYRIIHTIMDKITEGYVEMLLNLEDLRRKYKQNKKCVFPHDFILLERATEIMKYFFDKINTGVDQEVLKTSCEEQLKKYIKEIMDATERMRIHVQLTNDDKSECIYLQYLQASKTLVKFFEKFERTNLSKIELIKRKLKHFFLSW